MKHDRDSFRLPPPLIPLQQHPQFAAALIGMGQAVDSLPLPHGGTAQVLERSLWPTQRRLRMVSRGPIWPTPPRPALQWEGIVALRQAGVQIINSEATPSTVLRAAGYRQIMTPATIAVLDLRGSYADWFAAMSPKWRNAMRKAERSGLTVRVEEFQTQDHKWILEKDAETQSRKGFRALPAALTQGFAVMNAGSTLVITTTDREAPNAAMIFLCHGTSATYHIGWISAEGRACNAHNLCLSTAMDVLADRGVTTIDMGSLDTQNAPGLARFKLGAGARPRQLGGTWLRIPGLRPRPVV